MIINPDTWIHEATEQEPGAHTWKNGRTAPDQPGMYERYFTDGIFRSYWDGEQWFHANRKSAHWRQVGDYPAWRETEPGQTYFIMYRDENGKLQPVMGGDNIAEYATEQIAEAAARNMQVCRAQPYKVVELDL